MFCFDIESSIVSASQGQPCANLALCSLTLLINLFCSSLSTNLMSRKIVLHDLRYAAHPALAVFEGFRVWSM